MGSKNVDDDDKKMKKKNKNKSKNEDSNNYKKGNGDSNITITDSRFASVHSDPRFQKVPKHKSKVAIDSRFNRIFTDKRFASSSAPFDKRGRPKKHNNSDNSLRHYYRIEEEDICKEEEERETRPVVKSGDEELGTESSSQSDVSVSEDDVESHESETTGDSGGDDDDDDDDEVVYEEDEPEAQEEQIPEIEKETHRLAVVNMDWRHVKAVDLYMMLSSFLPKEGQINSVTIYPSEFGIQRMKEEELKGPVGLFDDENDKNDEDDDEIDNEKLRAYEKSRLRYYYAVVECDSIATADYLYKACDGVEFERSSNVLDMRFIPDSMEFKQAPCDVATEAPSKYEGLDFHTQVLQHSKINLTWDEDEPDRVKTLKRKFNDDQLAELELKEFLASDESESDYDHDHVEEDGSDKMNKKRNIYRTLLQSGDGSDREDEEDGQDMEVTFNPGLEDISNRILKKKDNEEETVWNATLRKMRERKKARKNRSKHSSDDDSSDTDRAAMEEPDDFFIEEPPVKINKESQHKGVKADKQHKDMDRGAEEASRQELELLLADDNGVDIGLKGYNLKPKKVKGKKGKRIILEEDKIPSVHYDDPRFSALFSSPLFALDPTDPQFKRSAAYARQLAMKQQKIEQEELGDGGHTKLPEKLPNDTDRVKLSNDLQPNKDKYELSSLVKSIKMKSKQVQLPSVGKMKKKR